MDTNLKSKENKLDIHEYIATLENKYNFQLLQNNCLKQQNKLLQQELRLVQSLTTHSFFEYDKAFNILMQLKLVPVTLADKLVAEDWLQLFDYMDILYGNVLKLHLAKYDSLSYEETALCYFSYIGISNINMAIFFGISIQSLCKRKYRLKSKLIVPL